MMVYDNDDKADPCGNRQMLASHRDTSESKL